MASRKFMLVRLALNAERSSEEKRGVMDWLRPEYQPKGQKELVLPQGGGKPSKKKPAKAGKSAVVAKTDWPKKWQNGCKPPSPRWTGFF